MERGCTEDAYKPVCGGAYAACLRNIASGEQDPYFDSEASLRRQMQRLGTGEGLCPVAEAAYEEILSLPIFPAMTDNDVERVIRTVSEVLCSFEK